MRQAVRPPHAKLAPNFHFILLFYDSDTIVHSPKFIFSNNTSGALLQ